ncbi:MAG: hypothetical protein DRP66_00170 [Planctomycetota bacterium]|nr:MAG: hypothetical protein DRP66_00170 [Planctomycetota bacterium]
MGDIKKANILYLCGCRGFRSDCSGRKILEMIRCWQSLGYKVTHFSGGDLYPIDMSYDEDIKAKQDYHKKWYRKLSFMSPLVQSYSEMKDLAHDQRMLEHLNSMVVKDKPDLIWERASRLSMAGLTVAKAKGIPFVHEWIDHLIPYRFSLYHGKAVRAEERKNHDSDYVVVVSEKLKSNLTTQGVQKDKILVVQNAVNPSQFRVDADAGKNYRKELNLSDEVVLIGYLGSYAFYHDMKRLILAANILRRRNVSSFKILMVGTGKQYPETVELAEKFGLLDKMIMMKPWVKPEIVPQILSALDVAVLPGCTNIICPIKVQEYMSLELPSVIPDYSPNRDVINDGLTGMLFTPGNEQSLADKLEVLIKDQNLRVRMGRQARSEVIKRFSWEKTWGKALNEIMGFAGIISEKRNLF